MASAVNRRYFPARRLLVRGQPSDVLRAVAEVFGHASFRSTAIDETTLELEIGSAAREFWLGDTLLGDRLLRFALPTRVRALAIHGVAVAQVRPSNTADAGHGETWLTVSSVNGLETPEIVVDVIDECLAYFARIGVLLDAGEPISGLDLPADSVCNPNGYRHWRRRARRT
jgi:hypothetical protein